MKMTREKALELLGLTAAATQDDVMRAFRRAVMEAHPDTGTQDGPVQPSVTDLLQAKKTALDAIAGCDSACAQCHGRGRVPHRIGTAVCGACKGTGDRTP